MYRKVKMLVKGSAKLDDVWTGSKIMSDRLIDS